MQSVVLRELGKWGLDVAKYVMTVVIVSYLFAGLKGPIVFIIGVLFVGVIMIVSLYLINKSEKNDGKQ